MAALAAPDDQPVKRDVQVVLDLKRTRAANEVAANAIEHGSRPGDEIEICRTLRRDRLSGSACRELRELRQVAPQVEGRSSPLPGAGPHHALRITPAISSAIS
jgi:hypothetical protein